MEKTNCLIFALQVWKKNPDYKIWYNSDHCINLPSSIKNPFPNKEFLPAEEFGYRHFLSTFKLILDQQPYYHLLLKQYFQL